MTLCEQCKDPHAHITRIGGMYRWLCWSCTKKAVLEGREKNNTAPFFSKHCPSCNKLLYLAPGQDRASCSYCKKRFRVTNVLTHGVKLEEVR